MSNGLIILGLFTLGLSLYFGPTTLSSIHNHTTWQDEYKSCQEYGNLKLIDVPAKCRVYFE